MSVSLPLLCSRIRDLESQIKIALHTKHLAEAAVSVFDKEDMEALHKTIAKAQQDLENQAKQMIMPNSMVHAATFAEQVNARLPILAQIRLINDSELVDYFEKKQIRLALQAQEMLRLSLKENVGSI